jgi:hypothetical protein
LTGKSHASKESLNLGYTLCRIRWLRRHDDIAATIRLMLAAPLRAQQRKDADEWWREHRGGLPPSHEPVVATVPALEFVKLLKADVVPTDRTQRCRTTSKWSWICARAAPC